jgi:uncharacterized protein (TIGR00269 family)
MNNCTKCQKQSFVKVTNGYFLCRDCFTTNIEKRVKTAIKKYNMLAYDSHVAIGLSGGKDSVTLLHIMKKIALPKTRLTAVIVDEGVEGYRPHGIEIAIKNAELLEIPYKVRSYKESFGYSLDEMLVEPPMKKTSCGVCGTFRRKTLNRLAMEIEADFLATGHNLDDEAESIVMNVLRGDPIRFERQSREPEKFSEKFVPRIKPLVLISQPEIVYYAIANNLEYHDDVCPYANEARRNSIREFLQAQEKSHFGTLKNILAFQDQIIEKMDLEERQEAKIYDCRVCGEPTDDSQMLCQGCKMLEKIKE